MNMPERDATQLDFVGKTITGFDGSSWNIWRFQFSDGTAIAIEAENNHVCGAGLQICDECAVEVDLGQET